MAPAPPAAAQVKFAFPIPTTKLNEFLKHVFKTSYFFILDTHSLSLFPFSHYTQQSFSNSLSLPFSVAYRLSLSLSLLLLYVTTLEHTYLSLCLSVFLLNILRQHTQTHSLSLSFSIEHQGYATSPSLSRFDNTYTHSLSLSLSFISCILQTQFSIALSFFHLHHPLSGQHWSWLTHLDRNLSLNKSHSNENKNVKSVTNITPSVWLLLVQL